MDILRGVTVESSSTLQTTFRCKFRGVVTAEYSNSMQTTLEPVHGNVEGCHFRVFQFSADHPWISAMPTFRGVAANLKVVSLQCIPVPCRVQKAPGSQSPWTWLIKSGRPMSKFPTSYFQIHQTNYILCSVAHSTIIELHDMPPPNACKTLRGVSLQSITFPSTVSKDQSTWKGLNKGVSLPIIPARCRLFCFPSVVPKYQHIQVTQMGVSLHRYLNDNSLHNVQSG